MNKTPNYQLNQWDAVDRVQRTDFNADNAKIDAALGALTAAMPKIVFGTYTGDGTASRHIDLGFQPKAVLLFHDSGQTYHVYTGGASYGGLALQGHPVTHKGHNGIALDDTGFSVKYAKNSNDNPEVLTNSKDAVYHYIAFA